MDTDITADVGQQSDNSSVNGSTNGSNGEYEFITSSDLTINGGEQSAGGQPIQIVKVSTERRFELDLDALSAILLRDSIRDKPVVVVSIAGDFRKGKSFMLNFFLRYLQSGCGTTSDWIGNTNEPLKGFSWRGGSERDTTGILMWSEPFVFKLDDGKEIAIVLMDTQGAFDSEYTVRDSATVFALSTMTSSIQVFNLMHNLQEDNLQVLEIFTEYGRLALEATDEKPFQKLVFLIRDWSFPYEHPYGLTGGQSLLEKKLAIKENQPTQLQRVRRHIRSCFSDINCFLMPHPGGKVATNPRFDGRLVDIDSEFVDYLKMFVPLMLDPKNVVVKEIGGRQVTGKQLMEYFKVYINVFAGETMPEPKSMLEATAEANNLTAVATVKDGYVSAMEELCGGEKPFLNPKTLESKHSDFRREAMDCFDKIPKMGGKEFSESYREQLMMELDQAFEHFDAQNKSKNMFNIFGTPMVLLVGCVVLFIISRFCELLGLSPIANLTFIIGTIDLGLLIAYLFCRYSGNYPDVIQFIDLYSEIIWRYVMDMGFKVMQNAVENRIQNGGNNRTTNTSRTPANTPTTSFSTHPLSSESRTTNLRRSPSNRQQK